MSPSLSWLHISDLHFYRERDGYDADAVIRSLKRSIIETQREHGLKPDFVFFTGDLAWGHDGETPGSRITDQLKDGGDVLEDICSQFRPAVPTQRLFIVPGNHDIRRSGFPSGMFSWLDQQFQSPDAGPAALTTMVKDKSDNWRTFMVRLSDYLAHLRARGYAHLLEDPERCIYSREVVLDSGLCVGIAGLNSAWCSSRGDLATSAMENGCISLGGDWQIKHTESTLSRAHVRIALVHHPLTWLHPLERVGNMKLAETRFQFLLHGHEHDQWVCPKGDDRGFKHHTISAGYCYGGPRDGLGGYNFVTIDPAAGTGKVILRRHRNDTAEWVPEAGHGANNDGVLPISFRPVHIAPSSSRSPVLGSRAKGTPRKVTEKAPLKGAILKRRGKAAAPATSVHFASSGFVVVSDVFDFGGRDTNSQRNAMTTLWKCHLEDDLFTDKHVQAIANPHGDGVSAAFPNMDPSRPTKAIEVLQFAGRLLKGMRKGSFEIRVGIHVGVFSIIKVDRGRPVALGPTANDCQRISAFGDSGHILCSEAFVDMLQDEGADMKDFDPPLHVPAFSIFKRKFAELDIRLFTGMDASALPPVRYEVATAVDQLLKRILVPGIQDLLLAGLAQIRKNSLTPEGLGARVSIFAPRREESRRYLYPSPFREHMFDRDSLRPGRTRYAIDEKEQGLLGLAFSTGKPTVKKGLPDWRLGPQAQQGYITILGQFGLTERVIRGWQRHSRAILCIPFGLFDLSADSGSDPRKELREPDGVVCIDTDSPLDEYMDAELLEVLETIRTQMGRQLATLWRLRLVS